MKIFLTKYFDVFKSQVKKSSCLDHVLFIITISMICCYSNKEGMNRLRKKYIANNIFINFFFKNVLRLLQVKKNLFFMISIS